MCYSGNCRLPQAGQFELLANFVNVNNQQRLQIVEAVHCEKQQPASMHTCWTILILFIHMLWTCDGLPGEPFFPSWFSSCTCCGPAVVYQVKLGCHLDSLPACVVDLWWFTRWTLVAIVILFLHVLWTCDGLPGAPWLPSWFSSCMCCGPAVVYRVNLGCRVDSLPACVVDLWWFTRWTLVAILILFLHVLWTCGGLPGEPRLPCWFSSCTCCGPVMVYQVHLGCHLDSLPAHVVDLWWFTRCTLVAILILFLHVLWTCGGLPGEPRLLCWFCSCTCCGPVMVYQVNLGCGVDSLPAHVVDLRWFTGWTSVAVLILFLHVLWTCDGLPGEPWLPRWFSSCMCCGPAVVYRVNLGCRVDSLPAHVVDLWWFTRWTLVAVLILFLHMLWTCASS